MIPKGAQHPNESWQLMKYLVSKRAAGINVRSLQQQAHASGAVFIPQLHARRDLTEWITETYFYNDPTIEPKFKDAVRVFVGALPISRFRPVTPVGQLLWNEHVRAMEAGIFKRYDAQDIRRNARMALDTGTAVVQAELDRIYNPKPHPEIEWGPLVAGYVVLLVAGAVGLQRHFNRKMHARGYFRREFRAGRLFAAPWFIGFSVFGAGPILFSLVMSVCQYDVFSPPRFVGFQNYVNLLAHDKQFYASLVNTLYMGLGIPLGMAVSLGIAMLLSREIRGMAIYRTLFYLPAIVPAVAAIILWIWMFNPKEGILNKLIEMVGLTGPAWLQDSLWSKPALILMGLWGAGSGMIVWLAGLKGIPQHLYEAAEIDGAGPFRQFWNITLPMLSPYIFFNLTMGIIGTFQIFTQAFIMTQGGPLDSTLFYAYSLFRNAFHYMRMGYASAMAWILFALVFLLTLVQIRLSRLWVHYESER